MRLKKPAVVITAAALMTVAACGGGGGSDKPAAQQTIAAGGKAGSGQDAKAVAPAADVAGAKKGGTVTVSAFTSPATLDPTRAYYTDSTGILSDLVTRALTQYKYDEKTKSMVLVPDMATDLGQHNADNTVWKFTLRDGLKYEDGTAVKAEDVAYAIKRAFAISELPDGPTYNQTFFLDGSKYKGPFKDGENYKGVSTSGNTITIKMSRPFGDMPYYASFPAFTAIPKAKDADPSKYGNHPMATGPYKFGTYRPGQSLQLVKNKYWDPKTDTTRHQYADSFQFNFNQDQSKSDNVLTDDRGSAQSTISYTSVLTPNYAKAKASGRLTTGSEPCTFMWYIDNRKITDVNVRRALAYAYPYRASWRAAGYIEGVTRDASPTMLPPGTSGRATYNAQPGLDGRTTDPKKAKALLKKAGALGTKIKWGYQTNLPESVKGKDQVVAALKEAGFDPEPVAATSDTIRDLESDDKADINIRSSGWCSDWPSGGSWFPAIFDGKLVGQPGAPNKAEMNQPAVNKEMNRILNNLTGEKANAAWGQLDKTMMERFQPVVLIGYGGDAFLAGSKVGAVVDDNVRGLPYFTNLFVK